VVWTGRLAGVALAEHRGTQLLVGSDVWVGRSVPLAAIARRRRGSCGTHTQRRGAVRARPFARGWRRRAQDDEGGWSARDYIYAIRTLYDDCSQCFLPTPTVSCRRPLPSIL